MKLPPFTLVHDRLLGDGEQTGRMKLVAKSDPLLARELRRLSAPLRQTLLASAFPPSAQPARTAHAAVSALRRIVRDIARPEGVLTLGIWDLGARVGRLPAVIERFNRASARFRFFTVRAAIPSALVRQQVEAVVDWAGAQLGRPVRDEERAEMSNNTIAADFFAASAPLRRSVGVDYLVGLTPSMIADVDKDEDEVYWDLFSSSDDDCNLLISTFEVREYARQGGRPFEAVVGAMIVGQLFVAVSPELEFHTPDTGCLFDFNEERKSIVRFIRDPKIDEKCLQRIAPDLRESANTFVNVVRSYTV